MTTRQASENRSADAAQPTALSEYSIVDPNVLAWPHRYYEAMHRQDPVHFDQKAGMYLVTRYDELQQVLRNPLLFSTEAGFKAHYEHPYFKEMKDILDRDGGGYFPDVMVTDPPYHTRVRRLMEKAFTAHRVAAMEPGIAVMAGRLIEAFADRGQADAMKEFAVRLTIGVIAEQLGVADGDVDAFQRWSIAAVAQVGAMQSREAAIRNAHQICELQNYMAARIEERRHSQQEDMISDLVHARLDDLENPTLTYAEIMSLAKTLLAAGNETTTTALGNLVLVLARQPDVARQLRDAGNDDRLFNRFTEELLRLEAPVRGLPRVAMQDTELGGTQIPKGSHLILLYASANLDAAFFEKPMSFDMTRKNVGQHLAFGAGIHRCIGAALARMEIKVAAREVVRRLDDIRLAVPYEELEYLPSIATRTLAKLPIVFRRTLT